MRKLSQTLVTTGLLTVSFPAWSNGSLPTCRDIITKQEKEKGIPNGLLKAIATIESGISPWTINAKGRGHTFRSKQAAAKYARELVQSGFHNFSIGCMQLHYASHHRHFKSIEAMFEPENNIRHAARLLKRLERRYGSLERAIKFYHSPSPTYHNRYQKKVYGLWAKFQKASPSQDSMSQPLSLQEIPSKSLKDRPSQSTPIKFGVGAAFTRISPRKKI